jgi:hypothetical protein
MSAAAGNDAVASHPRVVDGVDDIRDRTAQDDKPRAHVPISDVDRTTNRVVALRVRAEQLAVERTGELS